MSIPHFDLIVIGTGPSASTVARKCGKEGKRVAIIEAREFGGTCALRGCNPKKVYTNAANLIDAARGSKGNLLDFDQVSIDWAKLFAFQREFTEPVKKKSEDSFRARGIRTFHGTASFIGPTSILVGEQTLTAERIYVGVGASPRPLKIPGGNLAVHSDQFFELSGIPKRVVFIGGGYISMEFACVVARAGSEVTVLQNGAQVLDGFDPDLVAQLVEYSSRHGVQTITEASAKSIEEASGQSHVVKYEKAKEVVSVDADLVVHGAGRVPNLDPLDLKSGQVEFGERGIRVDPYMRSVSNSAVFAGGDCADSGQPRLTPTANEEARIVAKNLFATNPSERPDYGTIPRVAFTVPSIAAIGMSQSEAKESHEVEVHHDDASEWGSVRKTGQACSGYKILVDRKTDLILGAHLVGPGAEETINLFALAMKHRLTATDIKSTLFAFPTFASDVRRMI